MRVTTTVLCGLLLCLLPAAAGITQEQQAVTPDVTAASDVSTRSVATGAVTYQVSDASLGFETAAGPDAGAPESGDPSDAMTTAVADPLLYEIPWHSLNGGGDNVSGYGYTMYVSVAQAAVGVSSGGTYEAGTGYWYTGEPDTSSCSCPCHADPQCDGVTNVLDVVHGVNVAFRSGTPVFGPSCPRERTDVDCSGFTNVIDVVRLVNVAFRGGNPLLQFCNPCPL